MNYMYISNFISRTTDVSCFNKGLKWIANLEKKYTLCTLNIRTDKPEQILQTCIPGATQH